MHMFYQDANHIKRNYHHLMRTLLRHLIQFTAWGCLTSLILLTMAPIPALAYGQMTNRYVEMSTSTGGATGVTYTINFTPATTETATALAVSICDSPWETNSTCTNSGASAGANVGSTFPPALSSPDFQSGWSVAVGTTCGIANTASNVCFYDSSGKSITAGTNESVVFTGVTNPTAVNQTFYLNIFLSGTAGTVYSAPVDFGAVALSTSQVITVTTTVQESLTFCVGATVNTSGTPCSSVGSGAESLSGNNPSCPVMGVTYTCTGTSQMYAATNAASGYAIYYDGSNFSSGSYTIPSINSGSPSTPVAPSQGTEQFGLAITDEVNFSGVAGTGTIWQGGGGTANYCHQTVGSFCTTSNGHKFAYVTGGTGGTSNTEVASSTDPSAGNVYTVTYIGNIAATTPAGIYTATIDYVCTGKY